MLHAHFSYKILAPEITRLCFGFEIFWRKNFVQKMHVLMKLTPFQTHVFMIRAHCNGLSYLINFKYPQRNHFSQSKFIFHNYLKLLHSLIRFAEVRMWHICIVVALISPTAYGKGNFIYSQTRL